MLSVAIRIQLALAVVDTAVAIALCVMVWYGMVWCWLSRLVPRAPLVRPLTAALHCLLTSNFENTSALLGTVGH